jgi:hypothetical protein
MGNDRRRRDTAEFKLKAVKPVLNRRSVNTVADGPGINRRLLSKWERAMEFIFFCRIIKTNKYFFLSASCLLETELKHLS